MRTSIARASRVAALLAAGLLGTARPAAAQGAAACAGVAGNLVANCGFETGTFGGWTLGGNLSNTGVDHFSAHSGAYGASFANRGGAATLTQTLATTAGTRYIYRFWLLSEDPTYAGTAFVRALVGGEQLFALEGQASGAYAEYAFAATATGASTQLQFVLENVPSFYQLDDVSVAAATIPEPATTALLGAGLVALGVVAMRRRA